MAEAPFKKFRRVATVGMAAMFLLQNMVAISPTIMESREYRDLFRLTPFHSVEVHDTRVIEGDLYLSGSMVKRRCAFDEKGAGLTAYAIYVDGPNERTIILTELEDAKGVVGDRPASVEVQSWGVWRVLRPIGRGEPDEVKIIAGHWCPQYTTDGGVVRDPTTHEPILKFEFNDFAQVPWAHSTETQEM